MLLVRRGQEPLMGEWSLPGGALELGDGWRTACAAKFAKRRGLDVTPEEIVAVFDHISHAERGSEARALPLRSGGLSLPCCRRHPGSATDVTEARWASWNELTAIVHWRFAPLRSASSAKHSIRWYRKSGREQR